MEQLKTRDGILLIIRMRLLPLLLFMYNSKLSSQTNGVFAWLLIPSPQQLLQRELLSSSVEITGAHDNMVQLTVKMEEQSTIIEVPMENITFSA
eukprot:m.88728 g.88728  ORF g.88728 m.88728 type:complete len:94 (-) comp13184_c0_seq3:11-292(-)